MRYTSDLTSQPRSASQKANMPFVMPWEIAFDIDGVVADTMVPFVELVRTRLGIKDFSKEHITEYELYKCLPEVSKEKIDEILWLVLSDEYTFKIPPCPGAPEVLHKLAQYGTLKFVTARVWADSIKKWIHQNVPEVAEDKIVVIATGDPKAKSKILSELNVKVFVEDRWDTCENLAKEGFKVIVYDQPWNRKGKGLIRISHWYELEDLICWP